MVMRMTGISLRAVPERLRLQAAAGVLLPLLALAFAGCGETEITNTATAECTLNPSAMFAVEQDTPAEETSTATNAAGTEILPITSLSIAATATGAATWNVQATDSNGGAYTGTASGPAVREPAGADSTYPAGATVATFALQCAGLSGEIAAVALADIPLEVVRTTTTNGPDVVTGRHGEHVLTPQNTEYRLEAAADGGAYTLFGRAPVAPATIQW